MSIQRKTKTSQRPSSDESGEPPSPAKLEVKTPCELFSYMNLQNYFLLKFSVTYELMNFKTPSFCGPFRQSQIKNLVRQTLRK